MSGGYPTNKDLGRALRRLRHEREMTLESLAAAAGMHVTYLSRVERAHSSPTWEKLIGLARAMDIPVSTIAAAAEAEAERRGG